MRSWNDVFVAKHFRTSHTVAGVWRADVIIYILMFVPGFFAKTHAFGLNESHMYCNALMYLLSRVSPPKDRILWSCPRS